MLFVAFAAYLPCPVLGVAAAAVRSAKAVAAQEALLDFHKAEKGLGVHDRQDNPNAALEDDKSLPDSTDAAVSETLSRGEDAIGKLDKASNKIDKLLTDAERTESSTEASESAVVTTSSPTQTQKLKGSKKKRLKTLLRIWAKKKAAEQRAIEPNRTYAQATDANVTRSDNSTASGLNALGNISGAVSGATDETAVEERFDDSDVLHTPIWKLYVFIKDRFQNEMVMAMLTGTMDYTILYSALFLLGAWIILCLHRGKHQAVRGLGTLICVGCFLPCGAVTLCCPIDEYTPTDDEFHSKDESQIKP